MIDNSRSPSPAASDSAASVLEIQDWLIRRIAHELNTPLDSLALDRPIMSFAIDSIQILTVMTELEEWGKFRFPANPLDDDPTVHALAEHVAALMRTQS